MANLSDPEIFFDPGASEGQQESSLDREPITTKPLYSVEEIVNFAQIVLYCLGFLSNLPILVIFFKQGFNSSLNIGFFSLALSDMSVCVVHGTDLTAKLFQRYLSGTHVFKDAGRELSAWITAVIFWERLCSIILPDRVNCQITPKVTTGMILVYLLLLVIDMIVYFVADWVMSYLWYDPCSIYYDYEKGRYVWTVTASILFHLAFDFQEYVSLIFTAVPSGIVFIILVLENILFTVVLKRSADLRKPLMADKERIDSVTFTRVSFCICLVAVKHVFTSGRSTVVEIMFQFKLWNFYRIYYKHCRHIFDILLAINHSTNMFVYLIINPKFRKQFRVICLLKSDTKVTA